MSRRPEHVCAILIDDRLRLVLEDRPRGRQPAAGRLTCFGGKLRPGESVMACWRRELAEEIGRVPRPGPRPVDLWRGRRWIARFLVADWPAGASCHAGHVIRRLPCSARHHPRVSRWHRLVLAAWAGGRQVVHLPPP